MEEQNLSMENIDEILNTEPSDQQVCQYQIKQTYIDKQGNLGQQQYLDDYLPILISTLYVRKLNWKDFQGEPNYNEKWNAHIFWHISYTYNVQFRCAANKRVSYFIEVKTEIHLKEKSWVKCQNIHLLHHEQGHYAIGCLCALEFEKRCKEQRFSDNYRYEIQRVFQQVLKEYCYLERRYDIETNHRMNIQNQQKWETYIVNRLMEMQQFFKKGKIYIQEKQKKKK